MYVLQTEKSRGRPAEEVVVVDSNEPMNEAEVSKISEGLNIELCPNSGRNVGYAGIA